MQPLPPSLLFDAPRSPWRRTRRAGRALFIAGALLVAVPGHAQAPAAPAPAQPRVPAEVSADASRVYAQAKASLFQVRVLTADGRSQASAGSGFVVMNDAAGTLGITNYHVVSQLVLDPARFVAEAVGTGGETDDIAVLKVDVRNDLALIRLKQRRWPALQLRDRALVQGERLYSLGNPLDLGFAISEGAFNGEIVRPYYPQLLFSGAINRGMSGGPAVDGGAAVVGVNVSKRLDGEQISFLVPARFITDLLAAGAAVTSQPPEAAFRKDIEAQLLQHQARMTERLLAAPLATRPMGPYRAPVNETPGIRCWGSTSSERPQLKYEVNQLSCRTEATPFVRNGLSTGFINVRHEYIGSLRLDPLRFLRIYSQGYRTEGFGNWRDRHWTGPECSDAFVQAGAASGKATVPLRAVMCVRALRKFDGLFDITLMAATVDDDQRGLQSRVDISGVSLDNGRRIVQAFVDAIARETGAAPVSSAAPVGAPPAEPPR
jgi:serine protease Do